MWLAIAEHDQLYGEVVTGFLTACTLVAIALIGRGNKKRQQEAAEERAEIKTGIAPSNGHGDLGSALHSIEDKVDRLNNKVDGMDMKFTERIDLQDEVLAHEERFMKEHLQTVEPLTAWVMKEMNRKALKAAKRKGK